MVLDVHVRKRVALKVGELSEERSVAVAGPLRRQEIVGGGAHSLEHRGDGSMLLRHLVQLRQKSAALGTFPKKQREKRIFFVFDVRHHRVCELLHSGVEFTKLWVVIPMNPSHFGSKRLDERQCASEVIVVARNNLRDEHGGRQIARVVA